MPKDKTTLKKQAQEFMSKNPAAIKNIPPMDIKQLIEDLQVHQIELEMQNEELRRLQQDLEKERDKYSDLYDFSPVSYFTIDEKGIILEANLTAAAMVGVARGFLIDRPFSDFIVWDDQDVFYRHRRKLYERKTRQTCELRIRAQQGPEFYTHLESIVVPEDKKNSNLIRTAVTDIQARKQAEDAVRKSEKRYRRLVDTMNEGLGEADENYRFTYVNARFCEMLGYSHDEMIGRRLIEFVHDDAKALMKDQMARRQKGEEKRFELVWKTKGGGKVHTLAAPRGIYDENNRFTGSMGILTDITYLKETEAALRLSEEKYRLLVENASDAILIIQEEQIKFANQRAKQIGHNLGVELDRVPFVRYIHPDDRDLVLERNKSWIKGETQPATYAFRLVGHDDQEIWIELNAVQLNWEGKPATLSFLRDITLQRKLEKQLQLSQKMEAVGTLAGGVAHDFNNLLMGVQGRTSLMLLEMDPTHPHFEHLKEIGNYIKRATKLTKQLLGFARGGKYEVKPTDLNALIEKSSQMFGRTKKEITIYKKYHDQIWTVEVDQSQIDQVLLNIFVNAWQAMPGGGDLYIQTENEILDKNLAGVYGIRPGKYVVISITDTGTGMDEKTLKRVFDPFFTTKDKERGTGLGLASAYGIIKNHDGIITAESAGAKGATFHIYLPASDKPVIDDHKDDQKILAGTETILLVDDEEMIIDVGAQILQKLGYEVLTARHGKEAIEVYQQNRQIVAMVILDLIMPEMGGGETYDRLKEMDPNVKVLLSSGYSLDGQATEILNRGCDGFIQKPFSIKSLSEKLRQIILK
jgi:two-component system cell cycle sensor histidine kinase/response regulator CckA